MKSAWISVIKLTILQLIIIKDIRPTWQANINCLPIENCPSLISLVEKSKYSPETREFLRPYRCRNFKRWNYFWCPDSVPDTNQFANEQMFLKDNARYPSPKDLAMRTTSNEENKRQHHNSNGFIWAGTTSNNADTNTKVNSYTTAIPEQNTKNTVLSGHRINVNREPKNIQKETPEADGRIYFPDEELPKFTRKPKSLVLDKISSSCGRPFYRNNKSSANHTAGLGEFPWIALFEYDIGGVIVPNCAGTLISPRHVLTAASCFQESDESEWNLVELLQVVLGELDTSTSRDCVKLPYGERCGDPDVKVRVKSIVVHPGYRENVDDNNLAILTLEKDVEFSDFIMPICLPEDGFSLDRRHDIITASWQKLQGRYDYILKKTEIQMSGSRINPIDADGFCTGFPGSPLMIEKVEEIRSPYYLIGIDAGGVRSKICDGVQTSSVFIPRVRKWIDENID